VLDNGKRSERIEIFGEPARIVWSLEWARGMTLLEDLDLVD
jgi:hypothetical protein